MNLLNVLLQESVAYIPLIIFGSGFISSLVVKIVTVKIGKKRTYFVGCLIGSSAALWIYFGRGKLFDSYFIFAVAVFFGIGSSTMLVTALGIISDMIGRDVVS
ncbi:MFSD12 (predicted) [Pycnogonum litorale]